MLHNRQSYATQTPDLQKQCASERTLYQVPNMSYEAFDRLYSKRHNYTVYGKKRPQFFFGVTSINVDMV